MADKNITIKSLKNGTGKEPSAGQLEYGEIAVGYQQGKEGIYIKNSENEVVKFITKDELDEELKGYAKTNTASPYATQIWVGSQLENYVKEEDTDDFAKKSDLKLDPVGGDGKFIQRISQQDGKIDATAADLTTNNIKDLSGVTEEETLTEALKKLQLLASGIESPGVDGEELTNLLKKYVEVNSGELKNGTLNGSSETKITGTTNVTGVFSISDRVGTYLKVNDGNLMFTYKMDEGQMLSETTSITECIKKFIEQFDNRRNLELENFVETLDTTI